MVSFSWCHSNIDKTTGLKNNFTKRVYSTIPVFIWSSDGIEVQDSHITRERDLTRWNLNRYKKFKQEVMFIVRHSGSIM